MKLLIVGGVAGGASAAARARRLSEDAEIILFERGPDVSFANCGLPYHIGGEIAQREKLLIVSPERLRTRFNLDVRVRSSVESIDRAAKKISVRNLATGEVYEESYDKLILAPGAKPIRPPLPGVDLPGIYTLRNLEDMDRIVKRVQQGVLHAVVVGAGFIGLELVENLVRRGIAVTLVELRDQVLPPLDKEMTTPLAEHLASHGVKLLLSQAVESFDEVSGASPGETAFRIGVSCATCHSRRWRSTGEQIGGGMQSGNRAHDGIRVNQRLQTSDPDIYAVGDVIEVTDAVTGQPTQVPLAGPANRQGRIAVDNIFGRPATFRGTQGTAIVRVFERTAAITGASEKLLNSTNRPYRKVYVHPANHVGYFPGAEGMTLKLLFNPKSGRLLGAQAVGGTGVDKRIDVLSAAIQVDMTVYDLEEMELAYSPQFGAAKDPINMAGFVAAGLICGDHPQIDVKSVLATVDKHPPFLLDVRTAEEFAAGNIPNSVNIPIDELRLRLSELPRDRRIIAYCQVGQRGYLATRILRQNDIDAVNISGGYKTYRMMKPC